MIGVIQTGLAGLFKIIHRDINGNIKNIYDWQPNMVTNYGLEMFKTNGNINATQVIRIGSGAINFAITDTKLNNEITTDFVHEISLGADDINEHGSFVETDVAYIYYRFNNRFTFTAPKNISELGLSSIVNYNETDTTRPHHPNNVDMSTLVRVKDSVGNPTSISVIVGESLDVVYEYRKYYNLGVTDFGTLTCSIQGVDINYNIKGRLYGSKTNIASSNDSYWRYWSIFNNNYRHNRLSFYTGVMNEDINEIATKDAISLTQTSNLGTSDNYRFNSSQPAPLGVFYDKAIYMGQRNIYQTNTVEINIMVIEDRYNLNFAFSFTDVNGKGIPVTPDDKIEEIIVHYDYERYLGTLNPR